MFEVHCLADARALVQLAQPAGEIRIVFDAPQVALEVSVVHRIEAHQGGEQADIGLGQVFAGQVAAFAEQAFQVVQLLEQLDEGLLVGVLASGEASTVHAVVDRRIDASVEAFDLLAQRLRVEVQRVGADGVEGAVEDADDIG